MMENMSRFHIRPARPDEAGLFYTPHPEEDKRRGTIGHIRMDFGRSGNEFWHTWWPRGPEELNSPAFKAELQEVVDTMREDVLKSRFAMERFCYDHGGKITGGYVQNYGYIVETEHYRYCLRCNPSPGDYNGYLTAYDLDVQRQNMAQEKSLVGRVTYPSAGERTEEPAKPFALPPANKDMRRVFAYLIKHRSIARDMVAHFAKAGLLYEDAEYHNAVFVGTDTDGVPRHAHKRSANSYGKVFRLNVEGSNPRYSFHYVGTDRSLYVFEAPIDMLSFITLYPENWQRHSYVACCGTSIQPVLQMLEQAPQLDTVLLCLDNDEAGHQASRRMQNQLEVRYSVERLIPENKDWNDDLTLSGENAQGLAMNEMR